MMQRRFEVLLSGSREEGVDAWDLHSSAHLFAHHNAHIAPTGTATAHSYTSAGKHQLIVPDTVKPCLHTLSFSLSHTSSSSATAFTSSSLPSVLSAVALSPSSLYLAAASSTSGAVFVWSLRSASLVASVEVHWKAVTCLAWTCDERFVISGGQDGCVNVVALTDALRDDDDQRHLREHVPASALPSPAVAGEAGAAVKAHCSWASHSLAVTAVSAGIGSSHALVWSASLDHTVHAHSIVTQQTVARFVFPTAITALAVTSTASALFAASNNGVVYHQPLISAARKRARNGTAAAVRSAGEGDAGPSMSSSTPLSSLAGHSASVTCLALSFDCSLLASSSRDGSLRLWDARSLQCVRVIRRVGRSAFDWVRFVRDAGEGVDCPPLRAGRRRDDGAVRVRVARSGPRSIDGDAEREEQRRCWEDLLHDWRAQAGQDQLSGLRRELEEERRKRAKAEDEVAQWSSVTRTLYRVCAERVIAEQAAEQETQGTAIRVAHGDVNESEDAEGDAASGEEAAVPADSAHMDSTDEGSDNDDDAERPTPTQDAGSTAPT